MKTLANIKEGWSQYLVLAGPSEALLFAPVKVLPNFLQMQLLPCQAVFARAVLILDKLFLQPNIQPPFMDSYPHLPYVSLPCQTLSCCMAWRGCRFLLMG